VRTGISTEILVACPIAAFGRYGFSLDQTGHYLKCGPGWRFDKESFDEHSAAVAFAAQAFVYISIEGSTAYQPPVVLLTP